MSTTGDDIDQDGYTFSLDGGQARPIASNATVVVPDVPTGARSIAFGGIAGNCQSATPSPIAVTLAPDELREITLQVTCEPRLRISAVNSGADADVAYLVALDGGPWRLLRPGVRLDLPGVSPGSHSLRVAGIARNCTLGGPAQRQIIVAADQTTAISLEFACVATTRQILFGSTRQGPYRLYIVDHGGSDVVLVATPRSALHGRWSPDGAEIVYHSPAAVTGDDVTGFDIFITRPDGSGDRRLTTDGPGRVRNIFPDWSPDGTKVVFQKGREMWVMDANGANARRLRSLGERPRWSPDGSQIAFYDAGMIWLMDADGSNARVIRDDPGAYWGSPAWAPDGTRILFALSGPGEGPDIYVMNADGTGVVRLTHRSPGVFNEDADWSADGKMIAFRTNRDDGNPEIYVMNADGSSPMRIAANPWDEFGPAWRP